MRKALSGAMKADRGGQTFDAFRDSLLRRLDDQPWCSAAARFMFETGVPDILPGLPNEPKPPVIVGERWKGIR